MNVPSWKIKLTHYVIVTGTPIKLSENCVVQTVVDSMNELPIVQQKLDDLFSKIIAKDTKALTDDPGNIDVSVLETAETITTVTFTDLTGLHILEYSITL